MARVLKKSCFRTKIDTKTIFLSSIVSCRFAGEKYKAYTRREGIEYTGIILHSTLDAAIEEGKVIASKWYCYEQFSASVIGDISSGALIALNEKAIALTSQKVGDRFFVFKIRDKNCLLTKSRLLKMAIGNEVETSYQGENFIARKLSDTMFMVSFLEDYLLS